MKRNGNTASRDRTSITKATGKPRRPKPTVHDSSEELRASEERYRTIFDTVPISIWVEDFSKVIKTIDGLRSQGVTDFRKYLKENPGFVRRAVRKVKVIDVNDMTLQLFGAKEKSELLGNLEKSLIPEAFEAFQEELIAIAEGETHFEGALEDKTLHGMQLHLWRTIVFPKERARFNAVLVCLTDITERKLAEKALREGEARLLTVLEASPIAISLTSLVDGIVLYGNSALADLLGVSLSEIIGQKATDYYVDVDDRSRVLTELERDGTLRDFEVRLRRADNTIVWVSLSTEKTTLVGQTCLLSCLYDISERKRADVLQAAIYQMSEAANKAINLEELFRSVHSIMEMVMPVRNFYIALYDGKNDLLSFPYYIDEVDGSAAIPAARPGRGMTEFVIRTGKPLLSDVKKFEELARRGEVELVGPPSPIWIGAPLIVDGRTIGVIAMQDYHNPTMYTERELRILEYVSGQVAKAIERTRLYGNIQRNNRILSALQEATLPLISHTDLSEVLQAIITHAAQLMNTPHSYLYLVESNEKMIRMVQGTGVFSNNIGLKLMQGEGVVGKVWQTAHPLKVQGYDTWEGRSAQFDGIGIRAGVGVPLTSGSRVTGVLGLAYLEPERLFSDEDVELLSRFAQLASVALENARLYTLVQQELTERKMAERALQKAEARYRTLVEYMPVVNYVDSSDDTGYNLYISPQIENLLGYSPADFNEDPRLWYRLIHEEDYERATATITATINHEHGVGEYRMNARDGRIVWVRDTSMLIRDREGKHLYIQGFLEDVTERKLTEMALQASESRYRLSARATNDVIWEWDVIHDREIWSENLHSIFGYSLEDAGTDPAWWGDHIHPQDRGRMVSSLKSIMEGNETIWEDEYRFLRSDGSVAHVMDRCYIERDSQGRALRMIGAMSDITERKLREAELEALASVSAALRVAGSRAEILAIILDQSLSLLGARGAALTLLRPGTNELVMEAARGNWASAEGIPIPPGKSASRHVMESGRHYMTSDVENDSLIYRKDLLKGAKCFVSVPLSTPNGMMGTLNIGRQSEFSPEDVRLLANIADMAANAIQRASAFEQNRLQIERLKVLRTIDMFIASGTDVRLTLQNIINQAIIQLGIDAADILLLNPFMHTLEYAEGGGFRTRGIEKSSLRVGEGYAGRAALQREMVSIQDISSSRETFVRRSLIAGENFVSYHGVPLIAKGEVKGILEIFNRTPIDADREWLDFLESLAGQAALAIDNASLFENLQRSNNELSLAYETTLEGWSAALDMRDKETEGHSQRVTNLSLRLAEVMGLSDKERLHMQRGALLHDIGKMGIPDRILLKPDTLTGEEWEIMRQHPIYAHNMLSPIAYLRPALDIPYCHHEKWDGTGYPRGLKGEAIPLSARIFAVADVWDALSSDRPYRPAWAREKVLEHIKALSGIHFDPRVVGVFLQVVDQG